MFIKDRHGQQVAVISIRKRGGVRAMWSRAERDSSESSTFDNLYSAPSVILGTSTEEVGGAHVHFQELPTESSQLLLGEDP